ncbi:MAG TPA: SRPBCC family protein, partial [Planctomycetota bacterium]|nr:SRPBCC family protein [Planctomycetota bacterium]
WSLYWMPGDTFRRLLEDPNAAFVRWMLFLTSLPFLWAGVVLTLRRLRSAGLSLGWVALFSIPVLNLLFFAVLSVLPPGHSSRRAPEGSFLGRLIPRSYWGSAALAMALTVAPMGLTTLLAMQVAQSYGWTLFIGVPFMMGFYSSLICCYHQPRGYGACFGVATGSLALLGLLLLAAAFEGIICILMAAPLALLVAAAGTFLGYMVQKLRRAPSSPLFGLLILLPLLVSAEKATSPEAPLQAVRTSVEIDASPNRVWRHVVSFTAIPPPEELIFRTGLSYPLRAEILGTGPGAVRHCVFTTGAFVEPITGWDEPRRLAFGVTSQPAPMEEWTPWPAIHPPHLEGCFVSRRGQFLLEPLPGGRTRLEGTTWYTHELFPTLYWGLWSDAIIHRIHARVLRHVKHLAEGKEG